MFNRNQKSPHSLPLNELLRGVAVWQRVVGGAFAGPAMVVGGVLLQKLRGRSLEGIPQEPNIIATGLGTCVIIGAAVGAVLSLKSGVERNVSDNRSGSPFFVALCGLGKWSTLFFWIPVAIAITFYLAVAMPA